LNFNIKCLYKKIVVKYLNFFLVRTIYCESFITFSSFFTDKLILHHALIKNIFKKNQLRNISKNTKINFMKVILLYNYQFTELLIIK